ncbi:Uncharacterised protein [Escherichia coli]|uniref:Uncharacterized protein n=1 Tax=Escherichia coli TaxID=562 RepID=A0A377KCF6_ECOLX|nr:Uncharacterised protein [Escherichia coli]
MKTYNTNPGYEMDPQLLTHFKPASGFIIRGIFETVTVQNGFCLPKKHPQLQVCLQVRHVCGDTATD